MLTRSGVHAIRALMVLASQPNGDFCDTASLAAATGAPRNYLGKLLLTLSRRGFIESQKGLRGGFRLARGADDIMLYEVIEAIEDVARWKDCAFGGRLCSESSPCALHSRWVLVRDEYLSLLRGTSVATLANSPGLEDSLQPTYRAVAATGNVMTDPVQ
jgi:Rrf2 family protein